MSNLDSVFNTFQSGANAYGNKFTDHSYNVANSGTIAGKKRSSYISTLNSISTPTSFSPAGVAYKPTIDIETIGGVTPTTSTSNFMINAQALCITNQSPSNSTPGQYGFTKVGTFEPDANGNFVNHVGQFLKVVMTDANGNPLIPNMAAFDQLQTLSIQNNVGLPLPTTYMNLYAGLPGNAAIGANYSQAKLVYDAKGNEYNVVMSYTKIASVGTDPVDSERWQMKAIAETNTNPPVALTVNAAWTNGVDIVFTNGVPVLINDLAGVSQPVPQLSITPPATAAAVPININVNPGDVNTSDGLTTLGGLLFNNKDMQADGKGPGNFQGFQWDNAGNGIVSYDNGETQIICRLPLITFKSMNNLVEGSGGVFYASNDAGPYTIRFPAQGEIYPSAVEGSTASATDTYVGMAQDGKRFNACIGGLGKTIAMLDVLENLLSRG